jgi:hypothetical protein
VVEDVWTRSLSKLTVESAVRLNDVNKDGVMDMIVGYGTGLLCALLVSTNEVLYNHFYATV